MPKKINFVYPRGGDVYEQRNGMRVEILEVHNTKPEEEYKTQNEIDRIQIKINMSKINHTKNIKFKRIRIGNYVNWLYENYGKIIETTNGKKGEIIDAMPPKYSNKLTLKMEDGTIQKNYDGSHTITPKYPKVGMALITRGTPMEIEILEIDDSKNIPICTYLIKKTGHVRKASFRQLTTSAMTDWLYDHIGETKIINGTAETIINGNDRKPSKNITIMKSTGETYKTTYDAFQKTIKKHHKRMSYTIGTIITLHNGYHAKLIKKTKKNKYLVECIETKKQKMYTMNAIHQRILSEISKDSKNTMLSCGLSTKILTNKHKQTILCEDGTILYEIDAKIADNQISYHPLYPSLQSRKDYIKSVKIGCIQRDDIAYEIPEKCNTRYFCTCDICGASECMNADEIIAHNLSHGYKPEDLTALAVLGPDHPIPYGSLTPTKEEDHESI